MTQTAAAPRKPKAKDPAGPLKREAKRVRGAIEKLNALLAEARGHGLVVVLTTYETPDGEPMETQRVEVVTIEARVKL